jgi:hypothetical protein
VLIALLALGGLIPAVLAEPAKPVGLSNKLAPAAESAQDVLYTTPSIADFLNDSWRPSPYVPPVFSATASRHSLNGTIPNATYALYDFMKNDYASPRASSPLTYASAQNKEGYVPWTGESIYGFLADTWSPSAPIALVPESIYKMHQMN